MADDEGGRGLPSERLVLGFGIVIAACAYAYWSTIELGRGEGVTATPSLRALVVLGGTLLLAGLLRLIRSIDESGPR